MVEQVEVRFDKKLPVGPFKSEGVGVSLRANVTYENEDDLKEQIHDLFSDARRLVDAQVWTTKTINNVQ
jgi:hypothetical protein